MTVPKSQEDSARQDDGRDVPWTQSERYYFAYGSNMNEEQLRSPVASGPCRLLWRSFLIIESRFMAIPKRGTGPWKPLFRLRPRSLGRNLQADIFRR